MRLVTNDAIQPVQYYMIFLRWSHFNEIVILRYAMMHLKLWHGMSASKRESEARKLYSGAGRHPVGGDESAGDNRDDEDEHAAAPSEQASLRRRPHLCISQPDTLPSSLLLEIGLFPPR